jgi:hypothetical protein
MKPWQFLRIPITNPSHFFGHRQYFITLTHKLYHACKIDDNSCILQDRNGGCTVWFHVRTKLSFIQTLMLLWKGGNTELINTTQITKSCLPVDRMNAWT